MDSGDDEILFGLILFQSDHEFIETCLFSADLDFDVLELHINGYNCLAYFNGGEFFASCLFCDLSDYSIVRMHRH